MRVKTVEDAIIDARRGVKSMAQCPAHEDQTASLSVAPGREQPVLLNCHAGCETPDIIAAAGIAWDQICRELDPTRVNEEIWTPRGPASHVYPYVDENGEELFQVLRVPQPNGKKSIMQRHWDAENEKWAWSIQGVRRVLYRLHEVKQAVEDGKTIHIVEGEKDVETLRADGHVATCNPMGAGKWEDEYSEALRGCDVVVIADADSAGRDHARHVAESLVEHECSVTVKETTLAGCKDYTDHRAHGSGIDSLVTVWQSEQKPEPTFGLGIQAFLEADWGDDVEVIPGVLAQANVGLVTGFEGHGKTTFLRQMAACVAGGVHPFHVTQMEPKRCLFIDAENPEHQQVLDWRHLAGLVAYHSGQPIPNDMLTILSEWRTEPDLLTEAGRSWLYERVQAYRPDIVFMGPVQNLVSRDVKDDDVVRKIKHAVNTARSMFGSAFIIEHHAPHRQSGDKERSTRPYGSSLFQKWPDFGYGLKPMPDEEGTYELYPNRKPRVRARAWPDRIRWGKQGTREFPWEVCGPDETGSVVVGNFGNGGGW